MPKRSNLTSLDYIINAALPEATATYTVIPHNTIIEKTRELLTEKGFTIIRELYRCNEGAKVAQGVYHLKCNIEDEDLGLMFAWTNSYDKSTRFKCSIGGYVHNSLASLIGSNMSKYSRKHTGTADEEVMQTITDQIENANIYFQELIADKEIMKAIPITEEKRAELIGRMYLVNELLTSEQLGIVRSEFNTPSYDYTGIENSVWIMYNSIVLALQKCHPKSWMDQQSMVHYFICEFNKTVMNTIEVPGPDNSTKVEPVVVEKPVTNQIHLEDMISEVVAENHELEPVITPQYEAPVASEEELNHELHGVDNTNVEATFSTAAKAGALVYEELNTAFEATAVETQMETMVDDDSWPCVKCGSMQGPTAIFHDGQLCDSCATFQEN
jgi:hypothetical protein